MALKSEANSPRCPPYLNKVRPFYVTLINQQPNRGSVDNIVAEESWLAVEMRIEMNDTHIPLAVYLGHRNNVRIHQRLITANDDRNGSRFRDLLHHLNYCRERAFLGLDVDGRVTVIYDLEISLEHDIADMRMRDVARPFAPKGEALPCADCLGTKRSTARARRHVNGRSHDGDIDFTRLEILRREGNGRTEKSRDALIRQP